MATSTTRSRIGSRQSDLAEIHILAKALGWSRDEYEDIMVTVCGVRSSALLDAGGRARWLAHLRACQRANGGQATPAPQQRQRRALKPHESKMWALWMQLADARMVKVRSMKAIDGWVERQFAVSAAAFLNPQQQQLAIERLKLWLKRGSDAP